MVELKGAFKNNRHGRVIQQLAGSLHRECDIAMIEGDQHAAGKLPPRQFPDPRAVVQHRLCLLIRRGRKFGRMDLQVQPFVTLQTGDEFGFRQAGFDRKQRELTHRRQSISHPP